MMTPKTLPAYRLKEIIDYVQDESKRADEEVTLLRGVWRQLSPQKTNKDIPEDEGRPLDPMEKQLYRKLFDLSARIDIAHEKSMVIGNTLILLHQLYLGESFNINKDFRRELEEAFEAQK